MSEFAFLKSDGTGCRATCLDANARLVVSDGYYASGITLDKPDAIDLGKRLLEHFDVLPTKEEIERLVRQEHDRLKIFDRDIDSYIRHGDQPPKEWTDERSKVEATIAKLRRLVGEETGPLCREAPHARPQ